MKYIISLFKNIEGRGYFFRDAGDHVEEIYDLEKATIFSSKKAAEEAVKSTKMEEYCKIEKYDDLIEEFLKWKEAGMVRRTIPKINKKVSRPYNGEGLEEVIEFKKYHHTHEAEITYEHWKTWPYLSKFLDNFYDHEFYTNRNYTESYMTFKIKIERNKSSFEKFKEEFDRLIPHVTYKIPGETNDGIPVEYLCFSIFEHTCSEHGIYNFYFNTFEDKHKIVKTTYGHTRDYFQGTFEECYNEIKSELYYD